MCVTLLGRLTIKYVKGDVSIGNSFKKNVSQRGLGSHRPQGTRPGLNIFSAYSFHAAWTAFLSNLISKFPPCYMDSLHFNIYTSHSRNAKWTPQISTFTLQIHSVLHGQPIFQHLLFRFPAFYMERPHLNIFSSDFRHATGTAYISTFTLQILVMLHGMPTIQHLLSTLTPCYMYSLHFNIYSSHYLHSL